jgi:hypothetical protein
LLVLDLEWRYFILVDHQLDKIVMKFLLVLSVEETLDFGIGQF